MPSRSSKFLFFLLTSLLLMNSVAGTNHLDSGGDSYTNKDSSVILNSNANRLESAGYKAIIKYEDGFIAAGSEGKIDWIFVSGKVTKSEKISGENFNCLLSDNIKTVVGGDNGSILISTDKAPFQKITSVTDKKINSLAFFKGIIIAGADDGEILSGNGIDSFHKIFPQVKGNIVSLSANKSDCYGVTDEGEIIHTRDGVTWDVFDFNKAYADYYKPCSFTKILATEQYIAVTGIYNDGSPVLMFSAQGNVWSERTLSYTDSKGMTDFLTESPNDIFYDVSRDQFYLACNKGTVMQIPSCSHCNKLVQLSPENFVGISGYNSTLLIVGDSFCIKAINSDWEQ